MTTPLTSKAVLILFQVPWDWYPRATFGYGQILPGKAAQYRADHHITTAVLHSPAPPEAE